MLTTGFAPRFAALQRACRHLIGRLAAGSVCWSLSCQQVIGIQSHDFGRSERDAATGGQGPDSSGQSSTSSADGGSAKPSSSGGSSAGASEAEPSAGQPDDVAPFVVSTMPTDGARGVEDSPEAVIEFSEPMDKLSVERAYFQDPGAWRLSWNAHATKLTISTALDTVWSRWTDLDQPGDDADLAVTYGVGPLARDRAGNPIGNETTATYYLVRHVEHQLSLCSDLSGTASDAEFFGGTALDVSSPCAQVQNGSFLPLAVGDRDGATVVALLSYSLRSLPTDVSLDSASMTFWFDDPIGSPHELYGALLLEETHFALEPSTAFQSPSLSPLGVLAPANVSYPLRPTKDVTAAVSHRLTSGEGDSLVQLRARFAAPGPDANGMPDYARLAAPTKGAPTLTVSYRCASCP